MRPNHSRSTNSRCSSRGRSVNALPALVVRRLVRHPPHLVAARLERGLERQQRADVAAARRRGDQDAHSSVRSSCVSSRGGPRRRSGSRRRAAAAPRGSGRRRPGSRWTAYARRRPGGEAGALEPVLLGAGAAVVGGAAVGEDRAQARAARVPLARAALEHGAVPVPVEAVGGGGVGAVHPVLVPGEVEQVAADPRVPDAVDAGSTIGSLTAVSRSPGERGLDRRAGELCERRRGRRRRSTSASCRRRRLTYIRQPPSKRTSAGRSVHCAPKWSWPSAKTVL